jgi:hypothetical protein
MQLGHYKNVSNCVSTIVKREGIKAFYLSLPTTLMMNIPYGCIMVAVNESAVKVLNPKGDYSFGSTMTAGNTTISMHSLSIYIYIYVYIYM